MRVTVRGGEGGTVSESDSEGGEGETVSESDSEGRAGGNQPCTGRCSGGRTGLQKAIRVLRRLKRR